MTVLEPLSRFGDKLLGIRVHMCPKRERAFQKGINRDPHCIRKAVFSAFALGTAQNGHDDSSSHTMPTAAVHRWTANEILVVVASDELEID